MKALTNEQLDNQFYKDHTMKCIDFIVNEWKNEELRSILGEKNITLDKLITEFKVYCVRRNINLDLWWDLLESIHNMPILGYPYDVVQLVHLYANTGIFYAIDACYMLFNGRKFASMEHISIRQLRLIADFLSSYLGIDGVVKFDPENLYPLHANRILEFNGDKNHAFPKSHGFDCVWGDHTLDTFARLYEYIKQYRHDKTNDVICVNRHIAVINKFIQFHNLRTAGYKMLEYVRKGGAADVKYMNELYKFKHVYQDFYLGTRAINTLAKYDITNAELLVKAYDNGTIDTIKGLGSTSKSEIRKFCENYILTFHTMFPEEIYMKRNICGWQHVVSQGHVK